MTITVRQLMNPTDADADVLTDVTVDAFEGDAFVRLMVGGDQALERPLQRAFIKAAFIGGRAYVAELDDLGVVGGAVWFGPGEALLGSEGQAEAGFNQFMADLRESDPEMPKWWMEYFLALYDKFIEEVLGSIKYKVNGWHLQVIGVRKQYQRRGVGTALIDHVKELLRKEPDPEKRRICLETETEGALAFYKSVGFAEKGKVDVVGVKRLNLTLPMWCVAQEVDVEV